MAKQTRPSSTPVPIRFTEQMLADIQATADELDLSKQDVIRLSVAAGLKALQKIGYGGIADAISEHVDPGDFAGFERKRPPTNAAKKKNP